MKKFGKCHFVDFSAIRTPRFWIAITLPFLTLALHFRFLHFIQPYTWFLFFPTVFFSAQLAGSLSGFLSTLTSASLVWYFLMPPRLTLFRHEPRHYLTTFVFIATGLTYVYFQNRGRRLENLRRKNEIELRRREAQLEAAQKVGNFGSWALNLSRQKMYWSDEVYRILGVAPQSSSLAGDKFMNFVHPLDRHRVRSVFDKTLAEGGHYTIDYRIVRPDNTIRHIHSVGRAMLDESGKPIEMLGTMSDVTEQKKIELALRESEERLRGLLDSAYDTILILDPASRIEFANRRIREELGYSSAELIGRSIEVLLPEHIRPFHAHEWESFVNNPGSRYMGGAVQMMARRKDGTTFPVEMDFSPFQSPTGLVYTVFIKNVTDQRRAAEQQRFLSETTRILSETVDYKERVQRITEVIVPALADWCIVHILEQDGLKVKALAQIPELSGERVGKLAEVFQRPEAAINVDTVIQSGRPHFIERLSEASIHRLAEGDLDCLQSLWDLRIQSLISVPMSVRGRTIGVISFGRCKPKIFSEKDLEFARLISDRAALAIDNARLYQESQRSARLRQEILAIVSHDLKNPLAVIRGFNELIMDNLQTEGAPHEELQAAAAISRSVDQMDRLIRDLLDISKIDLGTFSLETVPCTADHLIREGIDLMKKQAEEKKIQIYTEIEPGLPLLLCDPERIRQVLGNILGNAIKFVANEGIIRLRSTRTDDGVLFSVSDNGPGIPEADIPRVFDRYWQAKKTAKLGSGLGLSIAKSIIETHHGKIWVESKQGEGTIFYFTLPSQGTQRQAAATTPTSPAPEPENPVLH